MDHRHMAANCGYGWARKTKNCKFLHFTDLPGCQSVSHPTNLLGELPLMENVSLWKDDICLSAVEHMGVHANLEQKKFLQSNQAGSRRRSAQTEKHVGAGSLKTGAQSYVLGRHSSAFHTERDASGLKMGGTFQVDCYQLKHPSLSLTNHSWGNTEALTDDEYSLHHWLISGVNQKDAYMSIVQGQEATADARKSRSSKLMSPSAHVCYKKHIKKGKSLTSRKNCQRSPKNVEAFWPLDSNSYPMRFHHHALSLKVEQPMLIQKHHASRANRTEAYKWNCDFPCQLPFVTEHHAKLQSQKLLYRRARLSPLQDVKQPFDYELNVLQQPKGKKNKPWRRSFGNCRRKTPATCPFSDVFKRNEGPSRAANVKAKRKSKHGPVLEMQNMKETQVMLAPVESLTRGSKSYTLAVGESVNNLDGGGGILAATRQVLKEGPRDSNAEKQEDHGHSSSNAEKQEDHGGILAANRQVLKGGPRDSNAKKQEDHGHSSSPSSRFKARTLSQKYRPRMLEDLIGQSIVARALSNAISKDKVAPVYLFQGSQGTGKTSAARIFAMAVNCITTEERKPCGICNECTAVISGNASHVWEVDAASHDGIALMHELIKSRDFAKSGPGYNIVIINECHMFSCETWSALMKLSEEPFSNAVFILITTEPDKLPRRVTSRCQKFHFLQIKHSDIVNRLGYIAKLENIFTEPGALALIASKSDGSLRSAETILDQVSLLEQRITLATIHKLVGSVSDDKLIKLLDLALCSDMARTVQKTKEIVNFGIDPLDLLSQLTTLIIDILGGSCVPMKSSKTEESSMHALSDLEMERLRAALRILSEAEGQLRAASLCRTTWLIAALLQLGPKLQHDYQAAIFSKSLRKASPVILKRARGIKLKVRDKKREVLEKRMSAEAVLGEMSDGIEAPVTDKVSKSELVCVGDSANRLDPPRKLLFSPVKRSSSVANEEIHLHLRSPSNVGSVWLYVLKCSRPSVRHLLENHGKLLALTFSAVNIVAHVVFEKPAEKSTAEMYHVCILNSFKEVLGPSVEVQFSLASDLQGAGSASCPATIADALCTQSTLKDDSGREVFKYQIKKESFDFKTPRIPSCSAIVVPPLESRSSCPPLLRDSSCSFSGAETATLNQHCSKSSILSAKRRFPMQCSDNFCSKASGGSNDSREIHYREQTRRHCWRLAKRLLCDCVLASSINANNTEGHSFEVQNFLDLPSKSEWQGKSRGKEVGQRACSSSPDLQELRLPQLRGPGNLEKQQGQRPQRTVEGTSKGDYAGRETNVMLWSRET